MEKKYEILFVHMLLNCLCCSLAILMSNNHYGMTLLCKTQTTSLIKEIRKDVDFVVAPASRFVRNGVRKTVI